MSFQLRCKLSIRTILAACVLIGLSGAPAAAQDYRGLQTIDIPYANGPIGMWHVPQVWLRLPGGAPHRFGMDTGSTGIVVAAEHYTPGPGDVSEGPGRLVYNSSGRILSGERYTTNVVIQRDEATPVATARVQVLRVTEITCLERARDCRPEYRPRGVAFMGVGFARGSAQQTDDTAPRNPFTNLVSLASGAPLASVRPGYIVTREGVHLGMSAERTRNFAFIKLAPGVSSQAGVPGWSAAPMTVMVDGIGGHGTVLVDTGINYMFLSPPEGTRLTRGTHAPAGTRIGLFMPSHRNPPAVYYGFTAGTRDNPMHPEKVEVVHDAGVFVNTGRMFLEGFDYLYDAAGGYVGFGWNGRLRGSYGTVTPGLY
jgi:hypothetical protein